MYREDVSTTEVHNTKMERHTQSSPIHMLAWIWKEWEKLSRMVRNRP